ncbi:MAG: hypothetical protein GXY83_00720 [Rhodopirellula sp.]|nr:hypothetical protein [Rhodopirellula sp.]
MVLPRSCRVVLVQPNDSLVYSGYKRSLTKRTPLGLAYVAGALLAAGHEVSIVDASLDDLSKDDVVDAVLRASPHVVGLTATTPLFPQVADLVRTLKEQSPDLFCVLGGPHVSSLPEASLRQSQADAVCLGDGEAVMVLLLAAIHEGRDLSDITSLCYRSDGKVQQTDPYRVKLWHPKTMLCPPGSRYPAAARPPHPAGQGVCGLCERCSGPSEFGDYVAGVRRPVRVLQCRRDLRAVSER